MQFSKLAAYLAQLEATTSRNEITRLLAKLLRAARPEEADVLCYVLLGELLPAYRGVEFHIAEKIMMQILAVAYTRSPEEIRHRFRSRGDMGDVAYDLASGRRGARPMSVQSVYQRMRAVADEEGTGSQERKIRGFVELLSGLDPRSAKYVVRIPMRKLRLGFSEATLLDALSLAITGGKEARRRVEAAYNVTADIGAVAKRMKAGGLAGLARLTSRPGIPIRPSLAERLANADEVIAKTGPMVGVEPKLDGLRVQIHVWTEHGERRVALFSRNLENTTAMFPEIVAAAKRFRVKSVILDGEAIGFRPESGTFVPFQETAQRKRKHGIEEFAKKVPLAVFVFDVLHLNGTPLLAKPFTERRAVLERLFKRVEAGGAMRLIGLRITDDPAVIEREWRGNVEKGLEGIVAKNLEAPYEAGSRGFHWIKLKATTAALGRLRTGEREAGIRMLDTVDCVVMGAYKGKGKRTAFGVGGLLLGVSGRDGRYYSISRLGTGLSDAQFREARARLVKLRVSLKPKEYVVDEEVAPDVWARPSLVAEVLADEVTISPRHTAGRNDRGLPTSAGRNRHVGVRTAPKGRSALAGRGYSLRFPRLVRFRDDKNAEDATRTSEIEKMYKGQRSF